MSIRATKQLTARFAAIAVAGLLWFPLAGPAFAGEKGFSSGDLTFEKTETVNQVRGKTKIVTRTISGVSNAKSDGGPLHEVHVRCHMTLVIVEGSKEPAEGSGYCYGIGPKGNTWNMLLSGGEKGGNWSFIDGTGRYDNIKGAGSWKHLGTAGQKNERYEWAGSWELQD